MPFQNMIQKPQLYYKQLKKLSLMLFHFPFNLYCYDSGNRGQLPVDWHPPHLPLHPALDAGHNCSLSPRRQS